MLDIRNILVPIDFSPDSDEAMARAADLAKVFGARLHVLHVVAPPVYASSAWGYTYPAELYTDVRDHAAARLAEAAQKLKSDGVEVTTETRDGGVSQGIVGAAEKLPADLIVMGTRGLTGVAHVFLGSVAERTLRHAPCPVLTVKAPAD